MAINPEIEQVNLHQVLQLVWSESTGAQILQTLQRWQVNNSINLSSLFLLTVTSPICTVILQFFTRVHNEMPV
jgi:hypothetical protein